MSAFDKVIGYEEIKGELMQIVDMMRNGEVYEKLGAKMPNGVLLSGDPGLGKTLVAKCFIEESGLKTFTIRKTKGDGDFVEMITDVFEKAKENAPCIVFLDDLDKFANEDDRHRDAEEYVAVQAGIDDVKGSGVFILATVNDAEKLPESLKRCGRFDRIIEFGKPSAEDAAKIIEYYLSDKKVDSTLNMEDLTKMIHYSSCAELETILNEAAVRAAYERKDSIQMEDLVTTVLKLQYRQPENYNKASDEELRMSALHEAGHLVVSEMLMSGSVGFAAVLPDGNGFVHPCERARRREDHILISLAGKTAVELYYSETVASGCQSDLASALADIRGGLTSNATRGFGLVAIPSRGNSENLTSQIDTVTRAMMEEYSVRVRNILLKNRGLLEAVADALFEKRTLLFSDIREIKEKFEIVKVAV